MSLFSCADENEINKSAVEIVPAGRTEIIHIILHKKKKKKKIVIFITLIW
jgi:hypothetical protein